MAIKCFNKALQCKLANNARKINLRYALKSTETAVDLWKNSCNETLTLKILCLARHTTPITGQALWICLRRLLELNLAAKLCKVARVSEQSFGQPSGPRLADLH